MRKKGKEMPEHQHTAELTPEDMPKILAAIFKRSQTDREFRVLCLENPGEAVFEVSGKRLPPGSTLRFVEPEEPGGPAPAEQAE